LGFLQPAFWVLVLLGIMILVHEAGHFWAALAVGIKVETFSIGLGPRLFGIKRGDTDFRIAAIPFGGYVRMTGEMTGMPGDERSTDPRSFQAKARWQRAIVIIAGPLMNIILAVAIVTGLYMYEFPKEVDTRNPTITGVTPGSPAAQAGLQAGDHIVKLNGRENPNWDYVLTEETLNANHAITGAVERRGARINFTVTPVMDPKEGLGKAGWSGEQDAQVDTVVKDSPAQAAGVQPGDLFISVNGQAVVSALTVRQAIFHSGGQPVSFEVMRNGHMQKFSLAPRATGESKTPYLIGVSFRPPVQFVKLGFADAFGQSLRFNKQNALMIFQVLGSIVERRVAAKAAMSGPIGIAQLSGEAAQQGAWSYLFLMAIVSLNLAIFNLLPIPILDGGTLLMLLIEMLLQREVSLQVKETVLRLGFVFLMMVVVFVIYNDISRILTKG
jgi:regulator of sigma E protease